MKIRSHRLILLWGAALPAFAAETAETPAKGSEDIVKLEKFVASEKPVDPTGLINDRPVNSAFGFDKSLTAAPKAITLISTQHLETVGIRVSDDLVKFAPSAHPNSLHALQGNISTLTQTSAF